MQTWIYIENTEKQSCFGWRQREEPEAPCALPSSVGCRVKSPPPAPGSPSTLCPCSHLPMLAWPPVATRIRPSDLPATPSPIPALPSMRRSLSFADLITALCVRVCAASRSMRSVRDLQGTLLQNIPLLFVFPPAFYRTVGFHGDFSPRLMSLNKWGKYESNTHIMETLHEEGPWSVCRIIPILLFPKYLYFCVPNTEHGDEECELGEQENCFLLPLRCVEVMPAWDPAFGLGSSGRYSFAVYLALPLSS